MVMKDLKSSSFVTSSHLILLLPCMSHWTDMVHQLLVLHEAPATEVAGARVPGDGAQGGVGGVAQQGGAPPLRQIVGGAREQRSPDQGQRVGGEVVTWSFC